MQRRPTMRTVATVLAAIAFPLTMLVGTLVGAYYKSNNPNDVDVTQGLAYLREILIWSWLTFGVIAAIIVALAVAMYRRDGNFAEAKLPLCTLGLVLVILSALMLANSYTDQIMDDYRQAHSGNN